jgi:hypothetical protein
MSSMCTSSESTDVFRMDAFADFDGAYSVFEDELSNTSSENNDDNRRSHHTRCALEGGAGGRRLCDRKEKGRHSNKLGRAKRWFKKMMSVGGDARAPGLVQGHRR